MKTLMRITLLAMCVIAPAINAAEQKPLVYINKNLGFNVPGYKYTQSEMPCNIDIQLVAMLEKYGAKAGLDMETVSTIDKIQNGTIPVLLMDIEQLVLGKDYQFGDKTKHTLPKVQVMAAVTKGTEIQTAKHTCAIATLNEFTPSSSVLDLGVPVTVCSATKKCLRDLSKDIIEWLAPQVK